jgi:glycosyltransferase 2 family protein
MKKVIITFIKISISIGLFYWLTNSGKIDFASVTQSFKRPLTCLSTIALFLTVQFFGTIRWKLILEAFSAEKFKFMDIYRYTWMGYFFNIALPGSVSGDVVKIFLVKKHFQNSSLKVVALSVLIDRIAGLFGFFTIIGLMSVFNYSHLTQLKDTALMLIHFNIFIFILEIIGIIILFLPEHFKNIFFDAGKKIKIKMIQSLIEVAQNYIKPLKKIIFITIVYSSIAQIAGVLAFTNLSSISGTPTIPLDVAFTAIPMGFITLAIPLAPGGFGVGHVAFENILQAFQVSGGANHFNLYFVWWTLFSLTGVIPYLLSGTKINKNELENENL